MARKISRRISYFFTGCGCFLCTKCLYFFVLTTSCSTNVKPSSGYDGSAVAWLRLSCIELVFFLTLNFQSLTLYSLGLMGAKNSLKLMAFLAPARAEGEAGVVAKADQFYLDLCNLIIFTCEATKKNCLCLYVSWCQLPFF